MARSFIHILGIQSFANQDSGAAILRASPDGEVLDYVAISEERLIRKKFPYTFPLHSLGYCMEYFGLESLDQIDALFTDHIRIKRWLRSGPSYPGSDFDYIKLKLDLDPRKVHVIGHHEAHAATAYYPSGFKDAAILIVDGNGSDAETTTFFMGRENRIELLDRYRFHGIGACYSYVTKEILAFGTGGEGKTMGLAPFGAGLDSVLDINSRLDGVKNDFSDFVRRMPMSDIMNHVADPEVLYPLKKRYPKAASSEQVLEPYFTAAAFDIQQETERVLTHLATELKQRTEAKYLCIAGGVGLNSVSNKIILDKAGFEDVYIFPACSDAGIPLGLVLWGYHNLEQLGSFARKSFDFPHAYTGKSYPETGIRDTLDKYGLRHRPLDLKEAAGLLAEGRIIGWLNGGSEYGPRALGNRSILADPRSPDIKDRLNLKIKHREPFRPYAPAILEGRVNEYFDLDRPSPYMLLIAKVTKPDVIPGVTHVDGTARVQTVNPGQNETLCQLLQEFDKLTGVPVLLNTSFNDAGEPIVETPEDAIINFLSSEMDHLVLEGFILDAVENRHVDAAAMRNARDERIAEDRARLLQRYCPQYDDAERDRYISETNKTAEWHTKYRSVHYLENRVREWVERKTRIIIMGTDDHTRLLPEYINEFVHVDVVGYIRHKKPYDCSPTSAPPYPSIEMGSLPDADYDEILISSWEYQFDILEELEGAGGEKPVYVIYDTSSRSFLDVLVDKVPGISGSQPA